jgi:hypothetical protein
MGTWNTKIDGNDAFKDSYQYFFDLYHQGKKPVDISIQIQNDFAEMFKDEDLKNNCLFGLGLALWETKSLDEKLFRQIKETIETGIDLEIWKGLGADEKTIENRNKELSKFLNQISTKRRNPKRRVKPKFEYKSITLLSLPAPDGLKTLEIIENYVNGEYKDTSSGISWSSGGGSIFHFSSKGKSVSAKWIDNQNLEIYHDKTIQFMKKDEHFFFRGDKGTIKYIVE